MSELHNPAERPVRKAVVSLGFTINMGDFNSLRLDITNEDWQRPGEDWNDAADRVYDEVERKIMEKYREAKATLKEG